jgi:hypothetical protein
MADHHLTLFEIVLLVLVGGAPALLIAAAVQFRYAKRRGWLVRGRRRWVAILLGLTVLLAVPLTVALWAGLPRPIVLWVGFSAPWPQELLGLLLVPSVLGAALASITARWIVRRGASPAAA